jgi:hypothetical protein
MVRGVVLMNNTDFSGFQIELTFLFVIFCVMAIWVFYNSSRYFDGVKRHFFWPLTLITGPIGLGLYLYMKRNVDL